VTAVEDVVGGIAELLDGGAVSTVGPVGSPNDRVVDAVVDGAVVGAVEPVGNPTARIVLGVRVFIMGLVWTSLTFLIDVFAPELG